MDKKDPETASQGSEKKDPEKTDDDKTPEFCKRIERVKDECVLQFNEVSLDYSCFCSWRGFTLFALFAIVTFLF